MKVVMGIAIAASAATVLLSESASTPMFSPVVVSAPAVAVTSSDERAAVERAVGFYLDGWMTGNVESLRKGFHPDARLFFVRNDSLQQLTQEQWYARIAQGPRPAADGRHIEVVSSDVANSVALVKVRSRTPTGGATDYLALAKFGGEWKIVNKTFQFEPPR
jgi:hypothetical protein